MEGVELRDAFRAEVRLKGNSTMKQSKLTGCHLRRKIEDALFSTTSIKLLDRITCNLRNSYLRHLGAPIGNGIKID